MDRATSLFFSKHRLPLLLGILLIMLPLQGTIPLQSQPSQKVLTGIDQVFLPPYSSILKGKKIALITNQTGINSQGEPTVSLFITNQEKIQYQLKALFAPEHGLHGEIYAGEPVEDEKTEHNIPVFSLYGKARRPTSQMLQSIDLLIFDIQDIGTRSYTFASTLFYAMEAAAKHHIAVCVLDRPNPINGMLVDGPMLQEEWRSFLGYINVPYCHGMTIGELAHFFNEEYRIGCDLTIIPMKGWHRKMTFIDTGLAWIPPSPHIPEPSTVWYYPTTGLLGELSLVNIGIGYTSPFKLIGAPWIDSVQLAEHLNKQNCPGARFHPTHFRPFYGKFAHKKCQGVLIVITNALSYKPVLTGWTLLGALKSLYPKQVQSALSNMGQHHHLFCQACGTSLILDILKNKKFISWELRQFDEKERGLFLQKRKKYLIKDYLIPSSFPPFVP